MPAQSKAQQRFMGMVHAADKGETPASPEVAKVSKDMDDKAAKDFASTKHKGLPDHVKEMVINELRGVKSIQNDYMKTVDAIAQTLEFYKKSKGTSNEKKAVERLKQLQTLKKKFADELDAKVSGMYKDVELKADVDEMTTSGAAGEYNTPFAFGKKEDEKSKGKRQADLTGYSVVNENRWLELKQDESTAQSKIGRGISNINKQLKEMERFLNWYGKIKNESGVNNKSYWKRTNNHIYSIKERLLKLDQKIRQISE
jgi:hypothetical protein